MDKETAISELGDSRIIDMYRRMVIIREFEERIRYLFLEGKMPGTIHQYIGMEACAVGVCSALEVNDVIGSTHRPNGHALAMGIPMKDIVAELYGKANGVCRGKGGAMHIGDLERGMIPAIAIVGANMPVVLGAALAFKLRKEPRVAVSFFGDGASNEGAFHEALNMAAVYRVPAVFVCENNQYGASTSIKLTTAIEHISDRAACYGMRGDLADGMDVLDVYAHAREALHTARSGKGPTLLELLTYRFCGHSRRDPSNYQPEEEKKRWKKKDSIARFRSLMLERGIITKEKLDVLKKEVEDSISEAIEYARHCPDPDPEDTYNDLYTGMEVPK